MTARLCEVSNYHTCTMCITVQVNSSPESFQRPSCTLSVYGQCWLNRPPGVSQVIEQVAKKPILNPNCYYVFQVVFQTRALLAIFLIFY